MSTMDPQALFDLAQQNDPNEQQREAQKAIAGAQPLMEEPGNPWITLPRGLQDGDRWDTQAVVRELTGVDEEVLAKYRKDSVLLIDAVTALGVESIGATNISEKSFDDRTDILRRLLIGEREQLFLAVATATFGDEKNVEYGCPVCEATSDVTISLTNDIERKTLKDAQDDVRKHTTTKGEVIEYRLVTGADQFDLYSRATGLTSAEQNTLLLTEVIVRVDGKPVVDVRNFVRNLGMKDRAVLIDKLIKAQPSPNMILNTECPSCGSPVTLPLTWELVFRP